MIILHGTNLIASREALTKQIAVGKAGRLKEVVRLEGESLELSQAKQALESQSLFGSDRLVVIENLFSRRRSKEKNQILSYLKGLTPTTALLLWERKAVTRSQLQKLPAETTVREFKLNPVIFAFLDAVAPGNTKVVLTLYHQCQKRESPEMIFYMLCRRIKDLTIALDGGFESLKSVQGWQKSRLLKQAKRFTLAQLLSLHDRLYSVDRSIKTGISVLPLSSILDLVLTEI